VGVEVELEGAGSTGREIGARRRVATETKPEERGFGADSMIGGAAEASVAIGAGSVGRAAAGDSGGDAGPGPVISSSESCSGSGSYTRTPLTCPTTPRRDSSPHA
jgi:hypothetical protein